jgi:hypothetical protein
MKTTLLGTLIAVGATFVAGAPARAENAMYSCSDANGVVALTNVPTDSSCEKLFAYEAPPPSVPTAEAAASSAPPRTSVAPAMAAAAISAQSAVAADPEPDAQPTSNATKPLMAQRRDDAIQRTREAYLSGQPAVGMNPAVNRRYLMISRPDYQRIVGVTP